MRGSSSLARGLLQVNGPAEDNGRIILARAGFTALNPWRKRFLWDHPRSRGVYASQFHTVNRQEGSSPLARGLLVRPQRFVPAVGIIPARAGFTSDEHWTTVVRRDHPRSRGVYRIQHLSLAPHSGSSPLARGLHYDPDHTEDRAGIIPARAGFTSKAGLRPVPHPDHPRSRGVYRVPLLLPDRLHGSSPLARGLPAFRWR